MIVIIDYGAGNLRSVLNAVVHLGYEIKLTNKPYEVANARAVILPGVGAAADTMDNLHRRDLVGVVRDVIAAGTPLDRPFQGVLGHVRAARGHDRGRPTRRSPWRQVLSPRIDRGATEQHRSLDLRN